MPEPAGRLKIVDMWVDPIDMDQALGRIREFLVNGKRAHSIFAVNAEKNFAVTKDPDVRAAIKEADLLMPDGISVVIAAKLLHNVRTSRVPGTDLMQKTCELAARSRRRVFIYGGKEEVNKKAVEKLQEMYPALQVVGRSDGYIEEDEMQDLIRRINESKAEILFLGLGSPRQEKWYLDHKDQLKTVKVCQGIGGTLDTIAGTVKRAPRIWQRCGLEWLYRLLKEPSRIKRQKILPLFVFRLLAVKVRSFL